MPSSLHPLYWQCPHFWVRDWNTKKCNLPYKLNWGSQIHRLNSNTKPTRYAVFQQLPYHLKSENSWTYFAVECSPIYEIYCFLKVLRLFPSFTLVTAMLSWWWASNISRMILQGQTEVLRSNGSTPIKLCPTATLSTTNLAWPDLDSNPGFRGDRPATNRLIHDSLEDLKPQLNQYIKLQFLPRSKHAVSMTKISRLELYTEITAVYRDSHAKYTNTLCAQMWCFEW
jgi:hypothetical protein